MCAQTAALAAAGSGSLTVTCFDPDGPAPLARGLDPRPVKYPPPVLAAAVLTAGHVSCLLVGSAALWLRGERISVGDADLVIEPGQQNLRQLSVVLARMALRPAAVPPVHGLSSLPLATVATSYGKVDLLLERGRLDWARLRLRAEALPVADAGVLTAAAADAWSLRRRFKR